MPSTLVSGLTQEFVDMLTAEMVPQADDKYVFLDSGLKSEHLAHVGTGNGITFKIDQQDWLTSGGFTESDRRLTDGTAVTATLQALTLTQYTATMREYGGPYTGSAITPLGLTELLKRRALHDVAAIGGQLLRRDYLKWQDKVVSKLAITTSNQTTADGTAAASIATEKHMSFAMLVSVAKSLKGRSIPTFPNGRYRGVIMPIDWAELMKDSTVKTMMSYRDDAASSISSGYIGSVAGIDLIEANTIDTVACGSGGSLTGNQSIFFGAGGAICHAPGLPVEVRKKVDTDYGRQDAFIWYEIAAYAALDLDWIQKGLTTTT